jgi:glucose/arabinose dehydrogenase/PKD repeat protein
MLAIVLALSAPAPASAHLAAVDSEFDDSPLITGLSQPTAVRFAPDGTIYVAEKAGVVKAFDQPLDPTPTTVVDLRREVHNFWDRGLLGMALDPRFGEAGAGSRRIWLLYARDGDAEHPPPRWGDQCPEPPAGPGATKSGCVITGRLVYVTLGAGGVAGAPVPVVENEWCAQFPSHTIGTVAFGPDGMLYAGAGEGASFSTTDWGQFGGQGGVPLNPCGDLYAGGNDPRSEGGALRAQDARTAEDPQTLSGTIVRVDPLTGEPAPGNPYASSPDVNRRRVIAYGLRNPFRFAFRPGSRELWVGDVGSFRQEELNRVDTDDADAENFGWPCFEGPARATQYASWNLCAALAASDVTAPAFSYAHGSAAVPGDGCGTGEGGSSISGIAFHGDSHYPAAYDGALFFADYARGCIWSMRPGADGRPGPVTAAVFAHAVAVDLQIGPEGELVYAHIGGEIRRFRYGAPHAVATADAAFVGTGKPVRFSAAGSFDPAGGPLTYAWDLDGDGAFDDGTAVEVEHVYQQPGTKTVRLRVTAAGGRTAVAAVTVSVGSNPPQNVSLEQLAPLRPWAVGDRLEFHGSADDEDASELTLTWTLTIRHCETSGGCHSHQIEQRTGPSASFTAPDHEWPSHLLVRLVARDKYGLTAEQTLRLDPTTVTVRAEASPRAPAVGLEGIVGPAPPPQTLIAGSKTALSVVSPQVVDGRTYRFLGWSDGSAELQRTEVVLADALYVARFEEVTWLPPAHPVLPDTTAPSVRVLSYRLRLARGLLALRVLSPGEPCTVRVRIRGRRAVERTLASGQAATVRVRLPAGVRRALRAGRRVTVRLALSATDTAGNRAYLQRTRRLAGAPARAR